MFLSLFLALLLGATGPAGPDDGDGARRHVERAPTRFLQAGRSVTLAIVEYRPPGSGPFPTLIFNHGSTGRGDDPSLFSRTFESPALARYFNERGWMVIFPQRRGRGGSDGLYDEGFTKDRSRYACEPKPSLAGLDRAKDDLAEIMKHVAKRPDVDRGRLLIGGQSRGGILSMAYAGSAPKSVRGVLNFVGGWIGEGCGTSAEINTPVFRKAARFQGPTLWLYGAGDPYYSLEHSRSNFDAFASAGGHGEFVVCVLGAGANGHAVLGHPEAWSEPVGRFLDALEKGGSGRGDREESRR